MMLERLNVREFLARGIFAGSMKGDRTASAGGAPIPVIDVRSPGEYAQGHIPGAINVPLFTDDERSAVGTFYATSGREEAFFQGLAFVGPKMEALARRACLLAGAAREIAVYCSRGGMRSGSTSWLFSEAGLRVFTLDGGYKAFRQYVLGFMEYCHDERPYRLKVLGGRTGCGKTEVLRLMAEQGHQVLDLEDMARHRGSAFGALPHSSQPSSEHFSNRLAVTLAGYDPARPVWVEDESENLGLVNVPMPFFRLLRSSDLIVLRTPHEQRLERVLREYGGMPEKDMAAALDRIRKRLGGLAHQEAHAALARGDLPSLAEILLAYYDRAYDKHIHKRLPVAVLEADSPETAAERLGAGLQAALHI